MPGSQNAQNKQQAKPQRVTRGMSRSDPIAPEDGPGMQFIEPVVCSCCNVTYSDDTDKLVLCELCNEEWKCIKCMNLTDEMYQALQSCEDLTWIRAHCKTFQIDLREICNRGCEEGNGRVHNRYWIDHL